MAALASEIELGAAGPDAGWIDYRTLRHLQGLTREQVAEGQRRRVFAVLPDALAQHGYRGAVVAEVIGRTHISGRTFYQFFDNKGDALRQCRDDSLQALRRELEAVWERPDCRSEDLAAVALRLAAEDPARARLLLADPWVTGPHAAEGWEVALAFLARLLHGGRRRSARLSIREEGLFGGARHLVLSRIYAARADTLPELAAPLAELILVMAPQGREGS